MTATSKEALLRIRIRHIASSPYGMKLRDIHERMSRDRKLARQLVEEMADAGKLFAVDRHRQRHARFFNSEADALAWEASGSRDRPAIRKAGLVPISESQPGSGWRVPPAPPKRTEALPVPKVEVLPSPKFFDKFQIDPETKIIGGWATLGIGKYL